MTDNDEHGFWDDERGRNRSHATTRNQRSRRQAPEVLIRPRQRPSANGEKQASPLVRRLGALCAVGLIAAPITLLVRGSDNDVRISMAEAAAATDPVVLSAAIDATSAPVDPAAPAPLPVVDSVAAAAPTVADTTADTTAATSAAVADTAPPSTTDATVPTTEQSTPASVASTTQTTAVTTKRTATATPVVVTKRACAVNYSVNGGDYWISIADSVDVGLADLLGANGATVSTPLYPGRTICLPANASAPTTAKPTPTTAKPTPTTAPPAAKPTSTTSKPKPTATTEAPATTAPPATTVAPPRTTYSRAEVEQIIRNVWPDDLEDEAVRIATRESNLVPTARNSCCSGLFQIYFNANKSSLVSWGITSANALFDPQVNAYAAYAMYLRAGGWGPWGG